MSEVMEMDEAQQRRVLFLAALLAHCKLIEPSGDAVTDPPVGTGEGGTAMDNQNGQPVTRKAYEGFDGELQMMELPKPPVVRAQEIILEQMERLDKIAADMVKPDEEGEMTRPELYDMESLAKAMAELNRELYRTFPPQIIYPPQCGF